MAIVDVVLTGGQSNMQGTSGATGKNGHPGTDPALCLEWNGGPGLVQVDDDVSSSGDYKALTGSLLPSFCNVYTAYSGRPLVVVRAAVGGTALLEANEQAVGGNGNWDTTGSLFGDSVTRCLDAIDDIETLGHTIGRVFVIWDQGARDAFGGNDLNLYQAATEALPGRWQAALSVPTLKVYIALLGKPKFGDTTPNLQVVRDAQEAACLAEPDVMMSFRDAIYFPDWGWSKNDGHYTQVGLNYMGAHMAEFTALDHGYSPPGEVPGAQPAVRTSKTGHILQKLPALPPEPFFNIRGTYSFKIPLDFEGTSLLVECEGAGGEGGAGGVGLKGGAGGGGAYAAVTISDPVPGETYTAVVGDGGDGGAGAGDNGGLSEVTRDSTVTVICRAVGGNGGAAGSPTGDGTGGDAASCIGDTTTSGQNGGVTGIDNGGNGAAPLGGTGGVGPGPNSGGSPGGGGAGASAGPANLGGTGADGLVKFTLS